jgi:hypothetical protein
VLGNPQRRYRIYLATGQQWRVWYGGERSVWAIGYTIGLNGVESGVVLRMSRIGSAGELTNTVQHELGHMVTLGGTDTGGKEIVDPINGREGIAEYIGYWPRPATASGRRAAVRTIVHRAARLTSIILGELDDSASSRASNAYYGLSHFAVDCLATRSARASCWSSSRSHCDVPTSTRWRPARAFASPFRRIDTGCVAWIKQHAEPRRSAVDGGRSPDRTVGG